MGKELRELAIEKPWIDCYTTYAHLFSILQCDERTFSWIFSNFIHIYMNKNIKNNSWGEFYRPMPYELRSFDVCKWIIVQKIRRELVVNNRDRLLEFIKNEIKNGYYVHLNIEHKHIKSFDTNQHWHDALIYGIDCEKDYVYLQDVFKDGRYERKILKVDEFLDSIINCVVPFEEDYMNGMIYSYKIKKDCDYEFNELNIWKSIAEYFNAGVPEYWNLYNNSNREYIVFGVDVYSALNKYVNEIVLSDERIDVRPFYFMRDHYIIIKKCIEWLKYNYYKDDINYNGIIAIYDELLKISDEINFLLIFVNKTRKNKKAQIMSLIEKMHGLEMGVKKYMPY